MGALTRMFQPQAALTSDDIRRALAESGAGGYIGGTSSSGISVSPHSAMCVAAVYACVNVIGETVGHLPLDLYRRTAKGKEKATDHPLFHLVGARPNSTTNSMSFREMLTTHMCLRGNGYAFKNYVGNGRIYELLPLETNAVGVNRDPRTWEITYTVSQKDGINGIYTPKEIFHVMGKTLNGYEGVTPLTYGRETIGLTVAAERHGAVAFKNGAKPSGVITSTGVMKDEPYKRLKEELENGYSGENAHRTMLLEGGVTFTPIKMTNQDMEYILLRGFQIPEIARFFRMPLHKIQDLTRSTNNNIEHQSLEFLTDTMLPWLKRWEMALNTQLLTPQEQKDYFFRFDLDDLMRADMKSRFEAYASGISSEILSPNECREKEDLNPYAGGEVYKNRNTKPADGKGGDDGKK